MSKFRLDQSRCRDFIKRGHGINCCVALLIPRRHEYEKNNEQARAYINRLFRQRLLHSDQRLTVAGISYSYCVVQYFILHAKDL